MNNVMGHNSFYAKMDLAIFGVLYEDRTPRSDPTKGGLSIGNVVEVDLENNSQKYTTHFNLVGWNWRDLLASDLLPKWWRNLRHLLTVCLAKAIH